MLQAVYASYVQTAGLASGMYWDPEDMQVLADSPAMEAALKVGRGAVRCGAVLPREASAWTHMGVGGRTSNPILHPAYSKDSYGSARCMLQQQLPGSLPDYPVYVRS